VTTRYVADCDETLRIFPPIPLPKEDPFVWPDEIVTDRAEVVSEWREGETAPCVSLFHGNAVGFAVSVDDARRLAAQLLEAAEVAEGALAERVALARGGAR
jgi:hypothetical protein